MLPSELLRKKFGFSQPLLSYYSQTCPNRYKKYKIDKRSKGYRWIAQPSKELKVIQRFLVEEFLSPNFQIHKCAMAYQRDISILDNARQHLSNAYLLKMDFSNFFPSIKATDLSAHLLNKQILKSSQQSEIELLSNFLFMREEKELILSIGAPSSPIISNAVMFDFDVLVAELCEERGVVYTRYSDDLTFSTKIKDNLFDLPDLIGHILEDISSPRIRLNEEKTVFSSKRFNRHVTGVTITNDAKASLGRALKRSIRTQVFLTGKEKHSYKRLWKLKGLLAHAHHIEPDFVVKLNAKYPKEMKRLKSLKSK